MVCETVGFILAVLLPSYEPLPVQKIECWTQVKTNKNAIVYEVIEGLEGVNVVYYNKETDTFYVTLGD